MFGKTLVKVVPLMVFLTTLSSIHSKDFYLGTRYGKRDEYQQQPQPIKAIPLNHPFARFLDISIQIPERHRETSIDRYSRSSNTAPIEVSPRNERFFMGTRYGKRYEESTEINNRGINDNFKAMGLNCHYITTGSGPKLYDCDRRDVQTPSSISNSDQVPYGNDQM